MRALGPSRARISWALLCVRPYRRHGAHIETFPEKPCHPKTSTHEYPEPSSLRPSPQRQPWLRPSSPARSPYCISGRPLLLTSCALSEERFEGDCEAQVLQAGGTILGWHWRVGGTYHSHFLLEVIQVPALFGLALLGRTLVIFFVLRGGDTVAVRTTRLRARRGSRATPALRAPALILAWPLYL